MIWSTFRLNKKQNKTRPIHIMFLEWFLIEIYSSESPSCLFNVISNMRVLFPALHLDLSSPTTFSSQDTFLYAEKLFKDWTESSTLKNSLLWALDNLWPGVSKTTLWRIPSLPWHVRGIPWTQPAKPVTDLEATVTVCSLGQCRHSFPSS